MFHPCEQDHEINQWAVAEGKTASLGTNVMCRENTVTGSEEKGVDGLTNR